MATADPPTPSSIRSQHVERPVSPGKQVAVGVGVLTVTKGADVLTTVGGLQFVSVLQESNPLAAAAMQEFGVLPTLLGLGTMTVLVIALLTECGVVLIKQHHDPVPADLLAVRLMGYGLASLFNLIVAAHNAYLVISV